jgi:hypothetical protein
MQPWPTVFGINVVVVWSHVTSSAWDTSPAIQTCTCSLEMMTLRTMHVGLTDCILGNRVFFNPSLIMKVLLQEGTILNWLWRDVEYMHGYWWKYYYSTPWIAFRAVTETDYCHYRKTEPSVSIWIFAVKPGRKFGARVKIPLGYLFENI